MGMGKQTIDPPALVREPQKLIPTTRRNRCRLLYFFHLSHHSPAWSLINYFDVVDGVVSAVVSLPSLQVSGHDCIEKQKEDDEDSPAVLVGTLLLRIASS